MTKLLSELRRRNVFRVAGVYAVIGWMLAQASGVLENAIGLPHWFDGLVVSLLLLGFPVAMVLAWAFEMTPEGVKRTEAAAGESVTAKTGRMLDFVIIGGLALVAALVLGNRFLPQNAGGPEESTAHAESGAFAGQSIAVLPFEDFSPDKDQAYFADGIAEELLNVLARVEGLRVASRTSAFYYKGREASVAEIGQALNVDHILEGSVRKAGNTLRITAQLIDTKSDEHLWSQTYDRPLTAENIFVIQDEISKAIVLELNGRLDLLPETDARPTQSTEAYDAYLKGKEAYGPRTPEGIEESLDWLGRAVTLDPDFAVAHAKLARAYALQREYAGLDRRHADFRGNTHIDRAMELAPKDWDVLSERAWIMFDTSATLPEKISAFDAAIAANPNNASAHRGRGLLLTNHAEITSGMDSLTKARSLDPRSAIVLVNMAGVYVKRDDIDGQRAIILDALRIDPDLHLARGGLALNAWERGEVETAYRIARSCQGKSYCDGARANIYAALGMDDNLAALNNEWWDRYLLFKRGETEALEQSIRSLAGANRLVLLSLYDTFNMAGKAYRLIQDNPAPFAFLLDETPNEGVYAAGAELSLLWAFEQAGDPRAAQVRASLAQKFKDVTPGTQNFNDAYILGAQWRMAENDPDGAMDWLNALADKGVPDTLVQVSSHWFAPLYDRPDYKAFKDRMLAHAARDRALIEAQLANPPEVWWTP